MPVALVAAHRAAAGLRRRGDHAQLALVHGRDVAAGLPGASEVAFAFALQALDICSATCAFSSIHGLILALAGTLGAHISR